MSIACSVAVRFRLDNILEARRGAGDPISQSELSRRSGVSLTTINAIVNNKTAQVSLATLDALSRALGVPPGDFLEQGADV